MGDEEWEEMGRDCGGWEWVDGAIEGEGGRRNEFGGEYIVFLLKRLLISTTERGGKSKKVYGIEC